MNPPIRSRSAPLFFAACLALLAVLGLAADGRAANDTRLPSTLAYVDSTGNIALISDSNSNRLTENWKVDNTPAWSPNGQQLVFARLFVTGDVEHGRELFRMNADGSGKGILVGQDVNVMSSGTLIQTKKTEMIAAFLVDDLLIHLALLPAGGSLLGYLLRKPT